MLLELDPAHEARRAFVESHRGQHLVATSIKGPHRSNHNPQYTVKWKKLEREVEFTISQAKKNPKQLMTLGYFSEEAR